MTTPDEQVPNHVLAGNLRHAGAGLARAQRMLQMQHMFVTGFLAILAVSLFSASPDGERGRIPHQGLPAALLRQRVHVAAAPGGGRLNLICRLPSAGILFNVTTGQCIPLCCGTDNAGRR